MTVDEDVHFRLHMAQRTQHAVSRPRAPNELSGLFASMRRADQRATQRKKQERKKIK